MAVNDIITENEYNTIRNKVISVLGTGVSNTGYGQTVLSPSVVEGDRITINEWGALKYDIINAYTHQNGSPPTLPPVIEGGKIRYNLSDAPVTYWDQIADSLVADRLSVPPLSQQTSTNHGSSTYNGTWGVGANADELVCYVSVTWSSADAARFFFNTGSYVSFSASRTGGSTHNQNTSWTNLLNAAGTQGFGGAFPAGGTSPADGQNFFRNTDNPISPWYSTNSTTPYGDNQYRIYSSTPGIAINSDGEAATIVFKVSFYDGHYAVGAGPDTVDGTFTVSCQTVEAFGTLQPPGTGWFTVETPQVTFLSFTTE